jgi:hypothetical protein
MAQFPERNLSQKAVYWGNPTPDGYGGFSYDDPVEIDCRWVNTNEVVVDAKGDEIVCHATVQVKQDLDEQGLLYLGELDDLDSAEEDNPRTVLGAYSIKRFDKIPTIKGTRFYRRAYL